MNHFENGIEDESEFTIDISILIGNVWKGIKKFGWLLIVLAALSAGIAYLRIDRSYYPYYTAASTFTVSLNADSETSNIYDDNMKASQMSKTFPYIVTSDILKNVIAADLGVTSVSESISAENVKETNLFTIKVTSSDPRRAYAVLQSVIKNYPVIAENVVGRTKLDMLDETGIPKEPSNRLNIQYNIKQGALPGAVLGVLIILVYAITRRTIHSEEDLNALSNIKNLGSLPKVVFKKRGRKFNPTISLLNEKITPAYRERLYKIRTRVEKAAETGKMKTILITSAIQGEGKSTVAFNLAMAIAEGGKKVVLVDGDLRHPSIKSMLPTQEDTIGLSEVLNQKADLEDALRYYEDINISVVAGSQMVQNASEIIGTLKMWEIINDLKKSADYIIIDTAPSAILSDASDLAKYADGIVYVVRQDYSKKSQVLEGLEHLSDSSSIEIIGCILNGVSSGIVGYGSYSRYGSYGYGRKKSKDELELKKG